MLLDEIVVELRGKYDLSQLVRLGFKRVLYRNDRYFYKFDGKLHRYTFIPVDANNLKITIRARRPGLVIPHRVTFGNFNDWLMKCVGAVQKESGRTATS